MNIDRYWRTFVSGSTQITLVEVIQDGFKAFFDFAKDYDHLEGDPSDHVRRRKYHYEEDDRKRFIREGKILYRNVMSTNDLSMVGKISSLEFEFKSIGWQKINNFKFIFTKKLDGGFKEYQTRSSEGDKEIWKLDRFDSFFQSVREIVNYRNYDAHNKEEKNDSGWALILTGHVFNLIELSETPVKPEKIKSIQANAIELLEQVIEIEDYSEDEEDKEEVTTVRAQSNESIGADLLEGKLDEMTESIEQSINESFDQINSSVNKILPYLDNMISPILFPDIMEEDQLKQTGQDFDFQPDETDEKEFEWRMAKMSDQDESQKSVDVASDLLNTTQAERELLILQKAFKATFYCKNWENIAQGPFRQEIIYNQIQNQEQWFSNVFIKSRYDQNKDSMDRQINSDLGEKYFAILERIVWTD